MPAVAVTAPGGAAGFVAEVLERAVGERDILRALVRFNSEHYAGIDPVVDDRAAAPAEVDALVAGCPEVVRIERQLAGGSGGLDVTRQLTVRRRPVIESGTFVDRLAPTHINSVSTPVGVPETSAPAGGLWTSTELRPGESAWTHWLEVGWMHRCARDGCPAGWCNRGRPCGYWRSRELAVGWRPPPVTPNLAAATRLSSTGRQWLWTTTPSTSRWPVPSRLRGSPTAVPTGSSRRRTSTPSRRCGRDGYSIESAPEKLCLESSVAPRPLVSVSGPPIRPPVTDRGRIHGRELDSADVRIGLQATEHRSPRMCSHDVPDSPGTATLGPCPGPRRRPDS